MNSTNRFDHWLDRPGVQRQTFIRDASIEARDTLDGAWAAVQCVFGSQARPEHALTLLPLVLQRADAARQALRSELAAQTPGETTPPPAG